MTTLNVVIDAALRARSTSAARSATELTRALIAGAPRGCRVEGVTASLEPAALAELEALLPGLAALRTSRLPRRELSLVWQHGIAGSLGRGLLHSPSLLAPLRGHERRGPRSQQVTVRLRDASLWNLPDSFPPRERAWRSRMLARAERFADAIIVPTHAVAATLAERMRFGDRIRVIGDAVAPGLVAPENADESAARLALPERYVLTTATLNPRHGLGALLESMRDVEVPLVITGDPGWNGLTLGAALAEHRIPPERVVLLGDRDDADLAIAYARASVFVNPSLDTGFGLASLEAFALGAPVVNSDAPALEEVAGGAGLVVERGEEFAANLSDAIRAVLEDDGLAQRLRVKGLDRARAFSWREAADRVWQLHADL